MKMVQKKIIISKGETDYNNVWCTRCDKYYCGDCIEFYTVDFDIEENVGRADSLMMVNFKDDEVCPWCYNQLVDLFNKK